MYRHIRSAGDVGYQGAGIDLLSRFRDECLAAGSQVYVVADRAAAVAKVVELVRISGARRMLLARNELLSALPLAKALREVGVETAGAEAALAAPRATFFAADVGVTGVDYLIAETGSIALFARPDQPRSVSLLPPIYIAVAERQQLLPDLFDLFTLHQAAGTGSPACVSLITGPSKTGDIELKLVTGVHGPGQVHVVVIDDGAG